MVFIDPATPDAESILQTLLAQTSDDLVLTIIKYDFGDSGLDTITDTLSQHTNVDAIHIVSHGSDGDVNLGTDLLNAYTS